MTDDEPFVTKALMRPAGFCFTHPPPSLPACEAVLPRPCVLGFDRFEFGFHQLLYAPMLWHDMGAHCAITVAEVKTEKQSLYWFADFLGPIPTPLRPCSRPPALRGASEYAVFPPHRAYFHSSWLETAFGGRRIAVVMNKYTSQFDRHINFIPPAVLTDSLLPALSRTHQVVYVRPDGAMVGSTMKGGAVAMDNMGIGHQEGGFLHDKAQIRAKCPYVWLAEDLWAALYSPELPLWSPQRPRVHLNVLLAALVASADIFVSVQGGPTFAYLPVFAGALPRAAGAPAPRVRRAHLYVVMDDKPPWTYSLAVRRAMGTKEVQLVLHTKVGQLIDAIAAEGADPVHPAGVYFENRTLAFDDGDLYTPEKIPSQWPCFGGKTAQLNQRCDYAPVETIPKFDHGMWTGVPVE